MESGHKGLIFFDFCFAIGTGGSSVSADRLKMVLVIMDLMWDTSVDAGEFPIRNVLVSL